MASLAEIGFSIRNSLTGFVSSDDERMDIEFIYYKIRAIRGVLLNQLVSENSALDGSWYQRINCLELKCDKIVCNSVGLDESYSYVDLPHTEAVSGGLVYLGSADFTTSWQQISWLGFQFSDGSQMNGRLPIYTVIGDRAFIKNLPTDCSKYVGLVGILENPIGDGCYTLKENEDYPIPSNQLYKLELLVKKDIMSTLQIPADQFNNANDDPRADKEVSTQKTRG